MATNKSKASTAPRRKSNAKDMTADNGDKAMGAARTITRPTVTSGIAMWAISQKMHGDDCLELGALVAVLGEQVQLIQSGDLGRVEAMLTAQAHTLDLVFSELIRRAALNMGEHMGATDSYMRLAFKAQGQCRATLETLVEIKNPQPMAFIRQQNIGMNQQVNNGELPHSQADMNTTRTQARAHGKIINQPNELLTEGGHHGATLDTGRTGAAIGTNQELEAVGTVNRR